MKTSADMYDYDDESLARIRRKKRISKIIRILIILTILFIFYFLYQYHFIKNLEKSMENAKTRPENAIQDSYDEYKNFFSKQPNITGVSYQDLMKKNFPMKLPPLKKIIAPIRRRIRDELIPERFPITVEEYKIMKEEEARKLYKLAKPGDKVRIRSVRGNVTGVFNGFGSKGASVRINQRYYAMRDLERESRALFDPELNKTIQLEYILRECDIYREQIEQFTLMETAKELRNQGYFHHDGEIYSPSEYLTALQQNRFKNSRRKYTKAKEIELAKLSPYFKKYLPNTVYKVVRPKAKGLKTMRQPGGYNLNNDN